MGESATSGPASADRQEVVPLGVVAGVGGLLALAGFLGPFLNERKSLTDLTNLVSGYELPYVRISPLHVATGRFVPDEWGLAYVIGLQEMVRRTTIVDSIEVRSIQLYSFVAILFFVICFIGSRISMHYEEMR